MSRFIVCVHDVTPRYARELRTIVDDLAPLVGRRLSLGVVPDWHGEWPLAAHRDFRQLVQAAAGEILLHGCVHRREHGSGPVSWLTGGSDEMNGLNERETRLVIERGQQLLADTFGRTSRGFLPPAWQAGRLRRLLPWAGLDYLLGYFSLDSHAHGRVRLATATWDCGRWRWLGHMGDAIGAVARRQAGSSRPLLRRVPVLAVHPRDLERGYWPRILSLTRDLLRQGAEPTTPAALLAAMDDDVAA